MKPMKLLFIIVCLLSITIGCSFLGSNEVSDQGDQQLTVLIGKFNDPLSAEVVKILKEVIIQFEAKHPGATVTLDTSTPPEQFDDKLLSSGLNEELPDITVVSPIKMDKYAENEILTDLSIYAETDNISMSDFYKPLLDSASRDGKWLTIPFAPNPFVVYYNKEWFGQANLAYPEPGWTWEDFSNMAQLLKSSRTLSGTEQFGGIFAINLFLMEPLILSQGGSILSPDGKKATGYLDSEASVRAVQYVVDFYNNQKLDVDVFKPVDSYNDYTNFMKQKTGMIVADASSLYYLQSELGNKLGVASLPSFQGGVRANPITMLGLSIMEQSDDKQLAWELLKTMTLEHNEFTKQWSQWFLVNNVPLAKSTGQDVDPFKTVFLDELNYIHKSAVEMNEYYVDAFNGGLQLMLNELVTKQGGEEIREQLTLIAEYIDNEMAKSEAAAAIKQDTP
jgi:ABC-type glycerol-3-phosphate transport system substrate-binding protein